MSETLHPLFIISERQAWNAYVSRGGLGRTGAIENSAEVCNAARDAHEAGFVAGLAAAPKRIEEPTAQDPALWLDPAEFEPLQDGRMVTRALTASATRVGRWRVPLWAAPQQEFQAPAQHPALVTALRGLLASLSRQPTEFELRAAAHEFTVMADRAAAASRNGGDDA